MERSFLPLDRSDYSLLTDLYQLTMIACYQGEGIAQTPASFELFTRKLPQGLEYLVAMGLTQVLEYLDSWHFDGEQIAALQATGLFDRAPAAFWSLLAGGGFTGEVWAVPEGTILFPQEPFLRIEAPLWQAQLVETMLLSMVNYQTLIASRAAQLRQAAGTAQLLEFGSRRAFGPQAGLWAARAALAGGMDATSNVLAALRLGVRPAGTMAHALVMALGTVAGGEMAAFEAFQQYFPQSPLLIDTYDPIAAAKALAQGNRAIAGVRLDSGDLVALSQQVRALLPHTAIFVSGDLDAAAIKDLCDRGAQVDGYGIGTKLVTGDPVNGVYKLVEIDGQPTAKYAPGKASFPGRKQVFRRYDGGYMVGDRLGLAHETAKEGEVPLLAKVWSGGMNFYGSPSFPVIRQRVRDQVASLAGAIAVTPSPALQDLRRAIVPRLPI